MSILDNIIYWRKDIGVALGAGGARGIAHFGVLRALKKLDYRIICAAGSSMGAIAAAMFAFEPDADTITERFCEFAQNSGDGIAKLMQFNNLKGKRRNRLQSAREMIYRFFFCSSLSRKTYILDGELLKNFVWNLLPDADIRDAKIPLAVVTFDLLESRPFVIEKGSLRKAVVASASIPGIFPPVDWDGNRLLVDGGGVSPIPVDVAMQLGAKRVLAVDVSPECAPMNRPRDGMEIMMRTQRGESQLIKENEMNHAWRSITLDFKGMQWWSFEYYPSFIKRGYETTLLALGGKSTKL